MRVGSRVTDWEPHKQGERSESAKTAPATLNTIHALDCEGGASGDASLQNVLDLGVAMLGAIPPYGHRELLLIFAGLSTCDPGNIFDSIKACKTAKLRWAHDKGGQEVR